MKNPLIDPLSVFVTTAIIADQIRLRVYAAGKIKYEVPLRRRQALGLGAQLVQLGLLPEYPHLEEPLQERIAGGEHGR